jgi:drug/metabolite transporter (DMT)-like permease
MTESFVKKTIVILLLIILACIAPYYMKKSIDENNQLYLILGFVLFGLLIYLIYYSLKIKISLLTTVLAYKLFPILILGLISSFVFNEFTFTITKWFALFIIIICVYILEIK